MIEILTEIASETTDQNVKDILAILGDLDKNTVEIVNELIENKVINFEYNDKTIQEN